MGDIEVQHVLTAPVQGPEERAAGHVLLLDHERIAFLAGDQVSLDHIGVDASLPGTLPSILSQVVLSLLRDKLARLYLDSVTGDDGLVVSRDANGMLTDKTLEPRSVDLLLTSPPYLDVVNYATANWIRLWWLGVDDVARDAGAGRRKLNAKLDHRHSYESYVEFMRRSFVGARRVLSRRGVAVYVIGDVAEPGGPTRPLAEEVWEEIGFRRVHGGGALPPDLDFDCPTSARFEHTFVGIQRSGLPGGLNLSHRPATLSRLSLWIFTVTGCLSARATAAVLFTASALVGARVTALPPDSPTHCSPFFTTSMRFTGTSERVTPLEFQRCDQSAVGFRRSQPK